MAIDCMIKLSLYLKLKNCSTQEHSFGKDNLQGGRGFVDIYSIRKVSLS